ncbi:MAG: N-6 DNA methylase [Acidimicrobiia bacterium]|nr:N-6 DNA methylase [Acidimicrobiia bacterium]
MSTAVIVVHFDGIDLAYQVACALGAPYVLIPRNGSFDLLIAKPDKIKHWCTVDKQSVAELKTWISPDAATGIKTGLRQPPLFDIPVDFLADAKTKSSEHLGPIVGEALAMASAELTNGSVEAASAEPRAHLESARLVVGALTALVIRDGDGTGPDAASDVHLPAEATVKKAAAKHPAAFRWLKNVTPTERGILNDLTNQLGLGINYRSMDPAVLSHVYEQALVDVDIQRELGIYYTPPALAARMFESLPVELIEPEDRYVLDPACGSGTLLVAAHDRLSKLQPHGWSLDARHQDLRMHFRGQDKDRFACEIARLALLLKAQPVGNGWAIETVDTLQVEALPHTPRIIVMNPPWRFTSDDKRHQEADNFMNWAVRHLAPGGLLGAIIPTSWLSSDTSRDTRDRIRAQFEIFELWRLPESTFPKSQQSPTVLFARRKNESRSVGKRVVRQVWSREMETFARGEPPRANFVVGDSSAPLSDVLTRPKLNAPTRALDAVAIVLSGQQPLPGTDDRDDGNILYLAKFGHVTPYGHTDRSRLQRRRFPDDFQGSRGEAVINRPKVLVSAARSAGNPWRFRVAVDQLGVGCSNSIRCLAPKEESDHDLLYALLAILGSGFASAYVACHGIDRNISARLMRSFPVPTSESTIYRLGELGREACDAVHDTSTLGDVLNRIEEAVWQGYGVDETFQTQTVRLLAGHTDPSGIIRYPVEGLAPETGRSHVPRLGAVLEVKPDSRVRIWINGVTQSNGVTIEVPPRMPGWMVRHGATFDARGIDCVADIAGASFDFQPMSWQVVDLEGGTTDLPQV